MVVSTPQYFLSYMEKEKKEFVEAGSPFVIVKKLTEEIIRDAIEDYCRGNAYWIKVYHLAVDLNIDEVNSLMESQK
ncbi:hypothetical protein ACPUYX_19895 [Desulfosporosinus sp. SYSU MS00001]|uniref:hypothetical protein n=1 Tax=Desulfosporosinus sp. SYSU MS00001 TaxID=3416284 RepID=UPI003CED39F7